jgi:hypothetical protein
MSQSWDGGFQPSPTTRPSGHACIRIRGTAVKYTAESSPHVNKISEMDGAGAAPLIECTGLKHGQVPRGGSKLKP